LSPEQSHSSIDSRPPFHDCAEECVDASNSRMRVPAVGTYVSAGDSARSARKFAMAVFPDFVGPTIRILLLLIGLSGRAGCRPLAAFQGGY